METGALFGAGALVLLLTMVLIWRSRAAQRADRLVRTLLTPAELRQLDEEGHLDVPSRSTPGRIYRIPARPDLLTVLDAGKPVAWLCLRPARAIPEREHVIVHKLLLEAAEADYWRRANCVSARWMWPDTRRAEIEIGRSAGVLIQR